MKRITFIEPVASMQGKLSGNRKLTYPTRNNSAWEAPTGKSYATNYRPSYIGNLRKKDGVTYFGTKVRSAVTMNEETRLIQALLGASQSITATMLKVPQILSIVQTAYLINQPEGQSMFKWCQAEVRASLEAHSDFSFIYSSGFRYIQNPFISTHQASSIVIPGLNADIVVKFWPQLSDSTLLFYVNGKEGVAHANDTFENVLNGGYNVLGLSQAQSQGFNVVKQGDFFVGFKAADNVIYAAVVNRQITQQDLTPESEPTTHFVLSATSLPVMSD